MKNTICKRQLLMALLVGVFVFSNCTATKNTGNENRTSSSLSVKSMIDAQKFVFIAERINPLRGRSRQLTSTYDVSVSQDSLVSYLPYFGRAYTAPLNSSEAGIQFTSTNFSYNATQLKSNRWNITLKPHDGDDASQLSFTIFDNGSASLMVTSNSKDPISFTGHLKQ